MSSVSELLDVRPGEAAHLVLRRAACASSRRRTCCVACRRGSGTDWADRTTRSGPAGALTRVGRARLPPCSARAQPPSPASG